MSEPSRQELITNLYNDVFAEANPVNVAKYFAKNYIQQTNYDVLDFHDFIEHVKSLQDGPRVSFKLEFLVDTPEKVVVRTLVIEDKQIPGAPPLGLLISLWEFNEEGLINKCYEVSSP